MMRIALVIIFSFFFMFLHPEVWALSDADHADFLKNSSVYANADKRLNEVWRELKGRLSKDEYAQLLTEQRVWLKGRDEEAAGFRGDRADAYASVILARVTMLAKRYSLQQTESDAKPNTGFANDQTAGGNPLAERSATLEQNIRRLQQKFNQLDAEYLEGDRQYKELSGKIEAFERLGPREAQQREAEKRQLQSELTKVAQRMMQIQSQRAQLGNNLDKEKQAYSQLIEQQQAEAKAKAKAEAEARAKTEAAVKAKVEAEAKAKVEVEARAKAEDEEKLMAGLGPKPTSKTYTNSIGIEFVRIPFVTRSAPDVFGETRITGEKPFYLGKYEVTQEQWYAVMGNNPAQFKGKTNPVEKVSWDDAQEFIKHLNIKEGHKKYRLPTEVEWEFAARGGTNTDYFFTKDKLVWDLRGSYKNIASQLTEYAWFGDGEGYDERGKKTRYLGNAGGTTHPVGQKKPNQYGLYDIYGNVWEWVQDKSDQGSYRVSRGGSWSNDAENCRSGYRVNFRPGGRNDFLGFRVALSPE